MSKDRISHGWPRLQGRALLACILNMDTSCQTSPNMPASQAHILPSPAAKDDAGGMPVHARRRWDAGTVRYLKNPSSCHWEQCCGVFDGRVVFLCIGRSAVHFLPPPGHVPSSADGRHRALVLGILRASADGVIHLAISPWPRELQTPDGLLFGSLRRARFCRATLCRSDAPGVGRECPWWQTLQRDF